MSLTNLHEITAGADPRGKAEINIGDIKSNPVFPQGLEYTPPARGTWTIAHTPMLIPGCHEIFVCPESCLRGVVLSAAEFDGLERFHTIAVQEHDLYTTSGVETSIITGVSDLIEKMPEHPPCIMIFSACVHHFLGTDFSFIYRTLREKYPDIDIIEGTMNCIMRSTSLHYDNYNTRALYQGIHKQETDPKSVNIVGSYFELDPKCELHSMLTGGGYTVRDLCTASTYKDYQDMGKGAYNFYTYTVGKEAAQDMEERLGGKAFFVPYSWDPREIDSTLAAVSELTGSPMPNTMLLGMTAEMALRQLYDKIGQTEIQIDAAATMRPLQLARLLLVHGFHVTAVYMDAVMPGDEEAFDFLQKNMPSLKIRSITNFRAATYPRDEAEKAEAEGKQVLAIGQKAAYFTGTGHFVNLIMNNGLWGYTGIVKLCDLIEDAYMDEKDTKEIIQIKAWGCRA